MSSSSSGTSLCVFGLFSSHHFSDGHLQKLSFKASLDWDCSSNRVQSGACVKGAMRSYQMCVLTSPRLGLTSTSSLARGLFFVPFLLTHVCLIITFCSIDIISCSFTAISRLPTSHCCDSAVCVTVGSVSMFMDFLNLFPLCAILAILIFTKAKWFTKTHMHPFAFCVFFYR